MGEQQTQDYWPCKVEKVKGESLVSFPVWTKGLLPVIVAALELERPALDYAKRPRDGKIHVILASASSIIVTGEEWEQIIRMWVLKEDPELVKHVHFESNGIRFLASSRRITYVNRLAALIHRFMQQPEHLRDILKALDRQDILSFTPVRNIPGNDPAESIGVMRFN